MPHTVDFEELYNIHKTQVDGFIRMRATQEADAQDISQNTWKTLHEKLALYDPSRPFRPFALYWASIMLVRYYSAREARRKVEVLFSELRVRHPDLKEEDLGEVVARFRANSTPSAEEAVIGAEEATRLAGAYDELLHITFDGPSPPHQLLAFGFCKLLGWTPREVVSRYSETPLRHLVEELMSGYAEKALLAEDRIRLCFERLRQLMEHPVGEVISDPKTQQTYRALLHRTVGNTTLGEYYTHPHEPTANIVQWWDAVRRRVLSTVQRRSAGPLVALLSERIAGRR
jgi:DNA-directed RNA polymerase specialized sigma24 family protein